MIRTIFGWPALLLFFLAGGVPAQAQMSDQAAVRYLIEARQAGKSDRQIGRELLARGVTPEQAERLKQTYGAAAQHDAKSPGQGIEEQRRSRQQATLPPEAADTSGTDAAAPAKSSAAEGAAARAAEGPELFGRDIFRETALTFEPNENQATPESYRLGPGDEVIIDIWGENERSLREEITPEGNIMIEQVGPVYLNGLTVGEANERLRKVFGQIYAGVTGAEPSSEVRLTLGRLRTIQVHLLGEVATPGTYRLSSLATLFNALYRAGGITPIGSLRDIRVMRGGREVARADLYELLLEGRLEDGIRLEEGDAIVVPPYGIRVEITGNVKRPMYYEMKPGESLGRLMEYAGGFRGDAYRDEVRVIRETGGEYRIFSVREPDYAGWMLEDGDVVAVGSVLDRFANRVEVRGAVDRPGMYELGPGLHTVRELIARAGGLRGDAFPGRALLLREREDLTLEMEALDLAGVMSGEVPDVALRRNDVLILPSIGELEERGTLTIGGEVARPGTYPYAANMTVEDLVVEAGGLLDGASTARIDIARRIKDPGSLTPSSELGRTYSFALNEGLIVDGEPGFVLLPYDIVEVRRSPAYREQQQVAADGEVLFPGRYTLIRKNERLSDLVGRAGGLTSDAYAHGARLIRRMNDEERAVRETTLRVALQNRQGGDSLAVEKLQLGDTYTVGIELDRALEAPGSDYDLVLREDDRLIVPQYVSTVSISGEVMYPNTVLYLQGKPLKYYVGQAGGYGFRAKRCRAYIVYMNGTVARVRSLRRARIEPGCQIVIPSKRERRGLSLPAVMSLATSAASIGTMAATIANLSK